MPVLGANRCHNSRSDGARGRRAAVGTARTEHFRALEMRAGADVRLFRAEPSRPLRGVANALVVDVDAGDARLRADRPRGETCGRIPRVRPRTGRQRDATVSRCAPRDRDEARRQQRGSRRAGHCGRRRLTEPQKGAGEPSVSRFRPVARPSGHGFAQPGFADYLEISDLPNLGSLNIRLPVLAPASVNDVPPSVAQCT